VRVTAGYIRTIREAVVEYVRDDEAVATAAKKVYSWAKDEKHPLNLSKSDLPAIVVMPGAAGTAEANNVHVDEDVVLSFMLAHKSEDIGDIEDMVAALRTALFAGAATMFGITGEYEPFIATLGGVTYVNLVEADGEGEEMEIRGWSWRAAVELTLKVRLTVRG
jgi:hypothetical protein